MDNRIYFFDTTLRDGEQTPGVSLQTPEKVEIAQALVRLGLDVIEAGFPAASEGDFEAVSTIAKEVRGCTIAALARSNENDVTKAAEALAGPSPAVPYSRAWLKGASSGATGPPTSMDEPSQTTIWGVRIVGSPDYSFSESVA